jgi:hypothetical protein
MSKDNKTFDLEDRLIDFAARIIQLAESLLKRKVGNRKNPGPKDPALVIPRGDFVSWNLNGLWSNGVVEELSDHGLRRYTSLVCERPRNRLLFSQYSSTPVLQYP